MASRNRGVASISPWGCWGDAGAACGVATFQHL